MLATADARAIEEAVITRFPFPLAVNLAYARRARHSDVAQREVIHLLVTFEAMLQFLHAVLLLDAASRGSMEERRTRLDEILRPSKDGSWAPRPDRPGIQDWKVCIMRCIKRAKQSFVGELEEWKTEAKQFDQACTRIQQIRNALAHPQQRPNEVTAREVVGSLRAELHEALRLISFLADYRLLLVEYRSRTTGATLVTPLRGATLPAEGTWLHLGRVFNASDANRDVVLINPRGSEALRLWPFYGAWRDQDDVDRLWVFGRALSGETGQPVYRIVDRHSTHIPQTETRLVKPTQFLSALVQGDVAEPPRVFLDPSASRSLDLGEATRQSVVSSLGLREVVALQQGRGLVLEGTWSATELENVTTEEWLERPQVGTRVVIKHAGNGDLDATRLRTEHRLLCQIHHPNVVRPLGLLELEGHGPILVLPRIAGSPLSDALQVPGADDSPPFQVGEPETIAAQLVDGLAAVHEQGAHGDIKPANVLYRPGDHSTPPTVVIIDLDAGSPDDEHTTEVTSAFGTRGYIAPELMLTGQEAVDRRRSDLYALAVTLYHIFTGKMPRLDSRRTGLDVSEMRGPRRWRLVTRWCGLLDPYERPDGIDEIQAFLNGRAEVPDDVDSAVPYRTIINRFWASAAPLVAVGATMLALLVGLVRAEPAFLTLPATAVGLLIWTGSRRWWATARRCSTSTRGALKFLFASAWIVGWRIGLTMLIAGGLLYSLKVVGPGLVSLFDFLFDKDRTALADSPELRAAVIVTVLLGLVAVFVGLQRRHRRAE